MIKSQELTDPASCMSRDRNDEMTFVLLGRDAAAPAAIRAWIRERIRLGKNKPGDEQIKDAWVCIKVMEQQAQAGEPGAEALLAWADTQQLNIVKSLGTWAAVEESTTGDIIGNGATLREALTAAWRSAQKP